MADVTIKYKGEMIAEMGERGGKTLNTKGTYCEDDIEVLYSAKKPIFTEYDGLSEDLIPSAIDTDGSIYNGTGYKLGYRLNSSGGESAQANEFLSGYIPYSENDVFVLKATTTNGVGTVRYVYAYDKDFKQLFALTGSGYPLEYWITPGAGCLNKPTQNVVNNQSRIPRIKYVRFSIVEYPTYTCTIHKAI